jgi:hypothetical protein
MVGSRVGLGFAVLGALLVSGCNENGMAALPGSLSASPSELDYGLVKENESFSQTVIVSHKGNGEAQITGLRFEPADAPFQFVGELPTVSSPWVLRANDFRGVDVEFVPTTNGPVTGSLVIETGEGELPVGLLGHGFHTTLEDFEQGGTLGGKADLLFIVDNSGSMGDKQTKLVNSFSTFINWLISGAVDYHIAVTTTDMDATGAQGAFVGSPKVLDTTTPNIATAFQTNAMVGTGGSGDEKGLAASAAAVSPALLAGANAGFLRNDARLYVVYVTDEQDASPGTPASFKNSILAAKNNDLSQVFFAAITGPNPIGCFTFSGSADAGSRYLELVDTTGGLFGSICDADFGVTLQNLAFEVTSVGSNFPLAEVPDPTTIKVMVNGIPQATTTWVYSAASNSVQFVPGYEPAGGDAVTISYDVL